jgi:transcriptional regulator with XRE-family HTH domain
MAMPVQPSTTEQIAARLCKLRGALTVRELARRSGVPPESVSRTLRGQTEPTVTTLAKLCAALGTDLPTFFDFARAPKAVRTKLDDAERLVLAILKGLPQGRRRQVARALSLMLAGERAARLSGPKRRRG